MAEASLADRGRMQSMTFAHSTNQSTGPLNKRSLSLPSLKLGNDGGPKAGTNTLRVLKTRGWVPLMIAALEGEAPKKSGSEPTPGRLAQSTYPESELLSTGHSQQNLPSKRPPGRSKVTEYGAAFSARIPEVNSPEDRSAGTKESSRKSNYEASTKYSSSALQNRSSPRAFQAAGERSMNTRVRSASYSQETRSQQTRDFNSAHSTSQASDINFGQDAKSLADAISRGDAGNTPQHAAMIVSAANHLLEAANKEIQSNNDPRYQAEMKRLITEVKQILPEFRSKAWISLGSGNAPPLETAMEVLGILNTVTSRLTDLGNFMKHNPSQNPAKDVRPSYGQVNESVLDTRRNLKPESLHLSSQESQEATPNLSAKGPIKPHYQSSEMLHKFSIANPPKSSSTKEEDSLHMRRLSEMDNNESPYVSAPEIPLVDETLQATTVEAATMFAKPENRSQNPKQASLPPTTSSESSFASKKHAVSPLQEATTRNPLQQGNPSTRRSHARQPSDVMQDIPITKNYQPWIREPTDKTPGSAHQSIASGNTGVATDVDNAWVEEVQPLQDSLVWRPQTGSLPSDGAVETGEFSMTGNTSPAENIGVNSQNQQVLVRNRFHSPLDEPSSIETEPLMDAGLRLRSQRRLEYNSILPDASTSIQTAGIGQIQPDRAAPFDSQTSTSNAHIKMKSQAEAAPLIPYNRTSKVSGAAIAGTDTVAEAIGKIPNPPVNSGPIFVVNWAPGGDLPSAQDVSAEQGTVAIRPQQHVAKLAAEQSELVKPSKAKHITEDFGTTPAAESSLAGGEVVPQAAVSGGSNTVIVKNNPVDAQAPVVQQNLHSQQQNETEGESATVEVYDVYGTRKRLRFCPWISWRSDGGGGSRRRNRSGPCAACCSCRTLCKGVCGTLLLGFLVLLFLTNLVILNVSVVRDTINMKSALANIVIPPDGGSTTIRTSSTTTRSSSAAVSITLSSMLPSDIPIISAHLSESTTISSTSSLTSSMSWTSSNIILSTSSISSPLSLTETASTSLSGSQSSTWSAVASTSTTSSTTLSSFSQSSSNVVASSSLLSTFDSSTSMLSATTSQSASDFSTSPSSSGSTQQSTMSSSQSLASEISSVSTSTSGLTTPSTSSSAIQTSYTGWSQTSSSMPLPSSSVSSSQTAGGSSTSSSASASGSLPPTSSFSMSSSDVSSSTTTMSSSTSNYVLSSSIMSSYSEASMTSSSSITDSITVTRISSSETASSSESFSSSVPTSTDILSYTQTSSASQTPRNSVTETPTPTPTSSEVVSSESVSGTRDI
ncbi:uncharacterized protein SPPG_01988 [Spizellomyces punctatus DAOM BR117]|uniref:Uncharacterized protein n=1 Tax=Spizellomyces punctatus (strain DAOM BR117) TaxID=645134 RepID=A0A0L0HPC2_SPIPD|nr:uncharacterized protein SPPG_01988 [Spizellomyces punctatus DAOM BR117]KND02908.1 hypothetical protein SPPG_01988 [Spizellomyces punctatus DAOM BR117]|eukprot:XP_016610947.1 hypothetical protein SPPG_01988 [Spizellomyces punctatus DAOM BR117]